jgi:hypothetical protein
MKSAISKKVNKEEIFLQGADLENKYTNVRELEEFDVESKNRKIIAELVKPILEDMDHDRKKNAMIDMRMT